MAQIEHGTDWTWHRYLVMDPRRANLKGISTKGMRSESIQNIEVFLSAFAQTWEKIKS